MRINPASPHLTGDEALGSSFTHTHTHPHPTSPAIPRRTKSTARGEEENSAGNGPLNGHNGAAPPGWLRGEEGR